MRSLSIYFVALAGSLLVFVGVFFLWGTFVNPHLPEVFQTYIEVAGFGTNNWLGAVLGLAAAVSSFLATLKRRR